MFFGKYRKSRLNDFKCFLIISSCNVMLYAFKNTRVIIIIIRRSNVTVRSFLIRISKEPLSILLREYTTNMSIVIVCLKAYCLGISIYYFVFERH